jgi:hypothetical protein
MDQINILIIEGSFSHLKLPDAMKTNRFAHPAAAQRELQRFCKTQQPSPLVSFGP